MSAYAVTICDNEVGLCAVCGHARWRHVTGGCTALTDDGNGFPTDCGCDPFEHEDPLAEAAS